MTVWFDDPQQLLDISKLSQFWPTSSQTPDERVNSTSRFILYVALVIMCIQKDFRVGILAAVTIGVLYAFYTSGMVIDMSLYKAQADDNVGECVQPTVNNPMGNVLISDYGTNPNRNGACFYPTVEHGVKKYLDDTFPTDVADIYGSRNGANRAFYSMPNTTIPNDQTGFAEALYGKKFRPMCRDDQSACSATNNPRQPELTQMRSMFGGSF